MYRLLSNQVNKNNGKMAFCSRWLSRIYGWKSEQKLILHILGCGHINH